MALTTQLDQGEKYWTLTLEGDLDYSECTAFRLTIDRVLKHSPRCVIIDLAGIDYLDSSGLGLLLSLSKEFGASGGHLVLVTNDSVDNILQLTRLVGIFSCASTRDEAVTMLADTCG